MAGNYSRLLEALTENILAVNAYRESLRQLLPMLEEKAGPHHGRSEIELLRLKNQSLFSASSTIRDLNYEKLNLLMLSYESGEGLK